LSNQLPKNIALIGMMGSGKSSVGRRLAGLIGYDFLDIDYILECQTGYHIQALFALKGEAYFRQLEAEWCQSELPTLEKTVIATGGGLIVNPHNQTALREYTTVVWLDVNLSDLKKRLRFDKKRPLSSQLETLYTDRKPLYSASAHIRFAYDDAVVDSAHNDLHHQLLIDSE
tara:strand:- start:6892 stop:7407 length:516 start_codon:yes stop_codon:yes gene_type:complete